MKYAQISFGNKGPNALFEECLLEENWHPVIARLPNLAKEGWDGIVIRNPCGWDESDGKYAGPLDPFRLPPPLFRSLPFLAKAARSMNLIPVLWAGNGGHLQLRNWGEVANPLEGLDTMLPWLERNAWFAAIGFHIGFDAIKAVFDPKLPDSRHVQEAALRAALGMLRDLGVEGWVEDFDNEFFDVLRVVRPDAPHDDRSHPTNVYADRPNVLMVVGEGGLPPFPRGYKPDTIHFYGRFTDLPKHQVREAEVR